MTPIHRTVLSSLHGAVERSRDTIAQLSGIDAQVRRIATVTVGLGVTGLVVGVWVLLTVGSGTAQLATLGTVLAGTVAPIWSLAGLFLIYIAFLGQRRQIVLQEEGIELNRQELRETRDELRGQKEQLDLQRAEMVAQNATFRTQAFEQSFFELLQFHRRLATEIVARPNGGTEYRVEAAFVAAANEIGTRLGMTIKPEPSDDQWLNLMSSSFLDICLTPHSDFGSYFRTMYHIVRHIDESDIVGRERYASLLRSQLSNAELILLVVNGLGKVGREKFKPLIERYTLLKPVRLPEQLARLRSFYASSAFVTPAFSAKATVSSYVALEQSGALR